MKRSGFTLIELMIGIAIIGICIGALRLAIFGNSNETSSGINGISEIRCISGYKFVVGSRGKNTQVLNETGGGVACSNDSNNSVVVR